MLEVVVELRLLMIQMIPESNYLINNSFIYSIFVFEPVSFLSTLSVSFKGPPFMVFNLFKEVTALGLTLGQGQKCQEVCYLTQLN